MAIWSGRPDPDRNISPWITCDGYLNWGHYCNADLDKILMQAWQTTDASERAKLYSRRPPSTCGHAEFPPLLL
ncbi:hypothetical protein DTW90_27590 [Neorhizobium sp. P12A]|uniref:hypothetical protein n=1 Tax=Neorhizobium sp. P12A TaxID=2268027 RepID=UPI0011EEE0F7|nr:hypothetical protein [Neorhizobium sp. P12A]KAA0691974.1 hypothetical protein DTW90_27590 [Neorhizobium sp. P12A]